MTLRERLVAVGVWLVVVALLGVWALAGYGLDRLLTG